MRLLLLCLTCLTLPVLASAQTGGQQPQLVLDTGGHTGAVKQVLFTPDDKQVITVSDDKTVRVWDVRSGETV
jgi:WD40 repeat protein